MYSIYFMKLETHAKLSFHFIVLISGLPYGQRQRLIKKTERSDTTILGTLGTLVHFRNFLEQLFLHKKILPQNAQK